ncbi:MAG TPA: cytidylate kinase family protein, partial [Burkholderiales bacterium]|nr:cytidylate kinase family protein [Burkholderiales bacterium]
MAVVSMSMELGALSKEVAEELARELRSQLIYPEVLDRVAQRMGAPRGRLEDVLSGRTPASDMRRDSERDLRAYSGAALLAAAARDGAVIRGWGASQLLKAVNHVAMVRICAPIEQRVKNLMHVLGTDDRDRALREIARSDASYAACLHDENGTSSWHAYHLVLNTERCSVAQCVEQILSLLKHPQFRPTEQALKTLADLTLAAGIQAAMRDDGATRGVDVIVEAREGVVTLAGMVSTPEERDAAARVASAYPGVADVHNALRTVGGGHAYTR